MLILGVGLFIIPNIFLITCTEIEDLNANIPIWEKREKRSIYF